MDDAPGKGSSSGDPVFHYSVGLGPGARWGLPGLTLGSAASRGTKLKPRRWEMCLLMRRDSWGAQELYLLKQCGNLITASVTGHRLPPPLQARPRLTGVIDLPRTPRAEMKCLVKSA